MDKQREKLVELIGKVQDEGVDYAECFGDGDRPAYVKNDVLADHLIANGVTVQEWISVKDRLPEDNSNVIACLWIGEESRIYPAFYAHGVWWDRVFSTPTTNTTTHWQPMPQPPKGE